MARANDSGPLKGHKAHLPHKPCQTCGRPMSWRKAWAKNWEAVRHCSDACRAQAKRLRAGKTERD